LHNEKGVTEYLYNHLIFLVSHAGIEPATY